VPQTKIVILDCPAYRLMNTEDYSDQKLEIGLSFQIQGFYLLVGQNGEMTYGNGPRVKITILDSCLIGLQCLTLLLFLLGTLILI
jgi:hypothetical protein